MEPDTDHTGYCNLKLESLKVEWVLLVQYFHFGDRFKVCELMNNKVTKYT